MPEAPGPYTELNTLSAFSLLEGAALPEDLVAEAARLGYERLALTDRDSLSGAVRFHTAARRLGIRPIFGAELTIGEQPEAHRHAAKDACPIPAGARLVLLARTKAGWKNLCRLLTLGRIEAPKGESAVPPGALADHREGLVCLTGPVYRGALSHPLGDLLGWKPPVPPPRSPAASRTKKAPPSPACLADRLQSSARILGWLREIYGEHLYAQIVRHGLTGEARAESILREAAAMAGVPLVAAGDVHHPTSTGRRLQDVLTCIRLHTTLDEAGRRLFPNAGRHLWSPRDMARRFSDLPEAIEASSAVADCCGYDLDDLDYRFPSFPLPENERDLDSYLRKIVMEGAARWYGAITKIVRERIDREMSVIEGQGLAGYFLVVWDIVRFCKERGILCQGRGSSVGSVVCHCLGITSLDPIGMDLLFERFLSEARRETPDIDLDIEHERREEVIQYVYERYGRTRAAMVCEVITYRTRSAVRDVGKALGFSEAEVNLMSGGVDRRSENRDEQILAKAPAEKTARLPLLLELVEEIRGLPRHLSIHVGGMVVSETDISEVVPVENAAMPGRTVIQWDKEDCQELGIVKIDLLGLGMLTMLRLGLEALRDHLDVDLSLPEIEPDDPRVYDLLCEAETLGVFQVESRAQMNTLPRVKPRCFYDLVVEVALIRPGPIQGEMVHPYLRRRRGDEPVTYLHPSLEPVLRRTLGVPLFQEQGMRVAIAAAGFSAAQADALRRAMGFRRATVEMTRLREDLVAGMTKNGITPEVQERIIAQITAFSSYGFPESHAAAFAGLVYASAWLKTHHPSIFYLALLNAQPMGFYSPANIVTDAGRHGVPIRPVDVNASSFDCTLEPLNNGEGKTRSKSGLTGLSSHAVRIGLRYVHGIGEAHREILEHERQKGPYRSIDDFASRTGLGPRVLSRLAAGDAFGRLASSRRDALWEASALGKTNGELFELPDIRTSKRDRPETKGGATPLSESEGAARSGRNHGSAEENVSFPDMSPFEVLVADHASTGLSLGPHPMALLRASGRARGALTAAALKDVPRGRRVRIAGQVIVRQRPGSAKGMVFLTLEDETGMANVAIQPQVYERFRDMVRESPFLMVEGTVRREEKLVSVNARGLRPLDTRDPGGKEIVTRSHDFH